MATSQYERKITGPGMDCTLKLASVQKVFPMFGAGEPTL